MHEDYLNFTQYTRPAVSFLQSFYCEFSQHWFSDPSGGRMRLKPKARCISWAGWMKFARSAKFILLKYDLDAVKNQIWHQLWKACTFLKQL